jgi:O-antigen/teichoic acid export membrane protein
VDSNKSVVADVTPLLRVSSGRYDLLPQLGQQQHTRLRTRLWNFARQLAASGFVRKVAETFAIQIILLALSLMTSVAVARTLGPQGRGLYAVAMAIGLIGVQLGNLGLHASNTYYVAQDHSLLPRLLGNSLAISLGLGGGLGLVASVIFWFQPRLAPLQGRLLYLGLAWIPFGLAYVLMGNLFLGLQDVRSYNKVEVLNRVSSLIFIGVVILCGRTTPASVFGAMMLGVVLSSAWTLSRLWRVAELFPRPCFRMLTVHFRLGIKAYLIALFAFLLLRFDLVMVKYLLGAEQAGYYSIASTMGDYMLMLPSVIGLILFPRLSAMKSTEEKLRQAKKAAKGTALALLPVLVCAGFAAKPVVHLLFGKAFLPAVGAFLWLIPGIFAMGIETAMVQFLNSMGFPSVVVWIWFFSTVLNVALNFWAIPHFGIVGASLASSLCYSLVLLAVVMIARGTSRVAREPLAI